MPAKNKQPSLNELAQVLAAFPQLAELLRAAADPRDRVTVRQVLDAYAAEGRREISARTWEWRRITFQRFAAELGDMRVAELTPLHVLQWLRRHTEWKSAYTTQRVVGDLKRAFNWALTMRMIREYPLRGIRTGDVKQLQAPMPDDDFRVILRGTPAAYRRFVTFLKFSGARPGEAASLRWEHVDFDRPLAILQEHKTARKTKKPRLIPLHPVLVKLLRWIRRHQERKPTAEWLAALLADGPMKVKEVTHQARVLGYTDRMLFKARLATGATYRRVAEDGKGHGHYLLSLPPGGSRRQPRNAEAAQHVFLNSRGLPWNRVSWSLRIYRLRQKLGRPLRSLYGLRHRFCTNGVKAGLNLAVVAALAGHRSVTTTMLYLSAIGADIPHLLAELEKLHQKPKNNSPKGESHAG